MPIKGSNAEKGNNGEIVSVNGKFRHAQRANTRVKRRNSRVIITGTRRAIFVTLPLKMSGVTTITSQDQINKLSNGILVLNFWADWSKQCEQTNDVFSKLAQKHTSLSFGQVEAEKVPDVTEKYSVLSVPFFVFLRVSFALFNYQNIYMVYIVIMYSFSFDY